MKRLAFLLVVLLAAAAQAQQYDSFAVKTTQNLTGSAPTLETDGASLEQAIGYSVVVSAVNGQTVTGGSLLCYYYGAVASATTASAASTTRRWMRCSAFDITPTTGSRDAPSGDFQVLVASGRIHYVPSSITVSSGTTVDVTITVRRRRPQ